MVRCPNAYIKGNTILKTFCKMSLKVRKRTFWHMRPANSQISLRMLAVWSESSLSAWRNVAFLVIQKAPSEDSGQTARMRRLIWIFAGRTFPKLSFLRVILKWSTNFLFLFLFALSRGLLLTVSRALSVLWTYWQLGTGIIHVISWVKVIHLHSTYDMNDACPNRIADQWTNTASLFLIFGRYSCTTTLLPTLID